MMGIRELDSMEGETRAVNEPKGSSDRSFRSPMAHLGLRNATLNFHQRIVGTAIQKEKSFVCCCGREAVVEERLSPGSVDRSAACQFNGNTSIPYEVFHCLC